MRREDTRASLCRGGDVTEPMFVGGSRLFLGRGDGGPSLYGNLSASSRETGQARTGPAATVVFMAHTDATGLRRIRKVDHLFWAVLDLQSAELQR